MPDRVKRLAVEHYTVLFPLLLSVIVMWRSYTVPGPTADSITYFQISRNILYAGRLGWEALWAPPLHSIILAAVSYISGIHDLLTVVSFVSPALTVLLVPTVYSLAVQIFDRRAALVAATLTAITPHLIGIGLSPEPEITYTFFLMLSLSVFTAAVIRSSYLLAALAGSCFSLAYLSRSEGFLIMVLLFLVLTALQGKRSIRSDIFRLCAVATVIFFIVSLPYLMFLKKHYGAFVISPKTSYVLTWMKSATYHDYEIDEKSCPELWGLNSEGKLRWQEPKGIGDLFSYLMSAPAKTLSVYINNLSHEIPGRIPNGSGMERYPQVYPVYLALAALLAVFGRWGAFAKEKRAILLAPLLILLVLPVFTGGWWKYLVAYLPILLVLAARGIVLLADLVAGKVKQEGGARFANVVVMVIVALIASRFYLAFHLLGNQKPAAVSMEVTTRLNNAAVCKDLGEIARKELGPGWNYMLEWNKLVYYLDGIWTALPAASGEELYRYAVANKVDYLVVTANSEEEVRTLDLQPAPYGFKPVGILKSGRYVYSLGFYRLMKDQ